MSKGNNIPDNGSALNVREMISPINDTITEFAELGFDELLTAFTDSDLLEQISFIKTIVSLGKFGSAIRNIHFIRKYVAFIGVISREITEMDRKKLVEEIEKDLKLAGKITEQTVIALDKFHNNIKAELLGKLFVKTFREKVFSVDEYNKLMFSIEMIHPVDGIERLREFYRYYIDFNGEPDQQKRSEIWRERANLDYSPLAMSGLLNLPNGATAAGNYGGAILNELGVRFFEEVCDGFV